MLELHTTKAVRDRKGEERRIGCYSSVKDIVEAMETSLESIGIMRNLVTGIGFDAFVDNRAILDRCAINFQIIGNQLGMLDPQLLTNSAMATAYSERSAIAHRYGNRTFDKSSFWEDINSDLDLLEQGCREVLDAVTSQDVVFVSPNRKPRRFFRRNLYMGVASLAAIRITGIRGSEGPFRTFRCTKTSYQAKNPSQTCLGGWVGTPCAAHIYLF